MAFSLHMQCRNILYHYSYHSKSKTHHAWAGKRTSLKLMKSFGLITMKTKKIDESEVFSNALLQMYNVPHKLSIHAFMRNKLFAEKGKLVLKRRFLSWLHKFLVEMVMLSFVTRSRPAYASNPVEVFSCLFNECRMELLRCAGDPSCVAYIGCVESCNNSDGETECQMKCGDLFENNTVKRLNECAVSKKKCIPKKPDDGSFPRLQHSVTDTNFNISDFSGKWYISSGLNPLFDTFDCQAHEFHPHENQLVANLMWRIPTPDGGFFTRHAVQTLTQDREHQGILHYSDSDYLHNHDDWYIISSKILNEPDDYIFIYYRGSNDAWDGYGGAIVYTRSPDLPSSIVPDLKRAAKKVGLNFHNFQETDNICGPSKPSLFERILKSSDSLND